MLPKEKITAEIAEIRGVPMDRDCISPATHSAFRNADELLDFVEAIAAETGLPVGIKSAVGDSTFWEELARLMSSGSRGVDFITIDGGEGGTGAGPLVFTDHVSLPFKVGFSRVMKIFSDANLHERVVFVGSGKLGVPDSALLAFSLGCDWINVGREALLSIGCLQTQKCHTNTCPTGVATQNAWLVRGLDPTLKAAHDSPTTSSRSARICWLSAAPAAFRIPQWWAQNISSCLTIDSARRPWPDVFGYGRGVGMPSAADIAAVRELMPK